MSFSLTAPHTPTLSIFLLYLFLLFRSSFQFLGRSAAPTPAVPVVTSSGRVAPVAVGDTVLLVEDVRYRVQKLFPADGTVVLQKINTSDRPFKRFISQIWVPPPAMAEASVDPASHSICDCPDPEPPRLLPDMSDFSTQVEMEPSTAHDTWCSLMTDYSSVDRLQRAFDEAKVEAQTYFDLNSQLLEDMVEAQRQASAEITQRHSEHEALLRDKEQLKASLADLNATHNELMAHSLNQTEQIGELRSTLPEPILCLLRQLLLTLPTDFDEELTPDDTLYHFLCISPEADAATLSSNSNLLLRSPHPDKSSTPEDPLVQTAGRLVPLITIIKRNLTSPLIRKVYDHCGLVGLRRLLQCSLRCPRCLPCPADGVPTRQGCLEYPQLQLLFSYGE